MPSQDDLDQRLTRLEEIVDRAIVKARETPLGRKVLAMLGLS